MNKRLIVVLGMHRGGTSAMTRGLKVFGFDLGRNLMPPNPANVAGYWEDRDITAFNMELLRQVTQGYHATIPGEEWHSLRPIPSALLKDEKLSRFRQKAIALLREKMHDSPLFGVKDPRMCRLLPFWKEVFSHLTLDVSYIVVSRNPASVARSIEKRNGFQSEKCHYLWLEHMLPSMIETVGESRIVVDYDLLMDQPEVQLLRIAKRKGLPESLIHRKELEDYKNTFIDENLRHTLFQMEDLMCDPSVPKAVIDAYDLLRKLAGDERSESDSDVMESFLRIERHLREVTPSLQYMTNLEDHVALLHQEVGNRDQCLIAVHQTLAERDSDIHSLRMRLADGDGKILSLNHEMAERDCEINRLHQAIADRSRALDDVLGSASWRITGPLRSIGRRYRKMRDLWLLLCRVLKHLGVKTTFMKALRIWKQAGVPGLQNRLISMQGLSVISIDNQEVCRHDYAEWIRRYDTIDNMARKRILDNINGWPVKPKISIILPVYDPPPNLLNEAIESIRNQLYPEWELCIADDASKNNGVRKLLEKHANSDHRIRAVFRPRNGHISAASNSAVAMASGDYLALFDHDDLLPEHALYEIARAILDHPDAGIIYSDEDKIDLAGRRHDPYFKCDWNPQLFLSQNMICHLGVFRASLVRDAGGFRNGFEGSQDYDLALRCSEHLDHSQIVHIPRILYHWRSHPASTASSSRNKPYALENGRKAIAEHLARRGISGKVELLDFSMYRVRYDLPEKEPLVSLLIPTRNGLHVLGKCIDSILEKTSYPNYEILIIDNGSDDAGTLSYFDSLSSNKRIRVVRDERPFNYSALNNSAVNLARGELIGLINNDVEVISGDWLTEMVSLALQPGTGAVGARLWYPNDTLQHGGVILGIGGVAGHSPMLLRRDDPGYFGRARILQNLSAVTAACLVVLKSSYQQVGGLNETDLAIAFNDVDFCLRLREAGYRNIWTPYAELYHQESASRGREDNPEKQARFLNETHYMMRQWKEHLLRDPAYNPNLALDHHNFGLAWPPRVTAYSD